MQIVRDVAGYSYGRSDLVRRAMSKKKHDVMAKEKEYFIHGKLAEDGSVEVEGAVRRGVPEAVAQRLFEEMTAFASYAFNKSHAAAYGVVAVQTAWLKAHYPVEFMAALMNSVTGNTDKVAFYIDTCRKLDIRVLPPDVMLSQDGFSVDPSGERAIRFGLGAVKNVGHGAVAAIIAARDRPYADLFDFIDRACCDAVNKKAVESLIMAGALDSLPGSRTQKLDALDRAIEGAAKKRKNVLSGQISLFGEIEALPPPALPEYRAEDPRKLLTMERDMTGVYISGHPLDEYKPELSRFPINRAALSAFMEEPDAGLSHDGQIVEMAGMIAEKRMKATRSGGMMAFVQLEDLRGTTEALVFPRVYERHQSLMEPETLVVMRGRLSIREEEEPKLIPEEVRALCHGDKGCAPGANGGFRSRAAQEGAPANGGFRSRATADGAAARSSPSGDPMAQLPPPLRGEIALREDDARPDRRTLRLTLAGRGAREQAALILMPTPGPIRVVFHLRDEGCEEVAPRNLWVQEGFDRAGLAALLGAESVALTAE